jgi:hypothetical protein
MSGVACWRGLEALVLLSALALVCAGCGHARPTRGVAQTTYLIDEDASGVGSALGTGGAGYDCDEELSQCFNRCWESSRKPYPHTENNEWYYEHCLKTCRQQYMQCIDELEKEEAERVKKRPPLEFSSFDATGGAGALILAPLAL